jgi:DNA replication protein DnaC
LGLPGVGETHLAIGLTIEALEQGNSALPFTQDVMILFYFILFYYVKKMGNVVLLAA